MPANTEKKSYRVRWEIDVDARNVTEAAKEALKIQRDGYMSHDTTALVFSVCPEGKSFNDPSSWVDVDLSAIKCLRR
jgi:hypothetical protein